ncbi:hypothetical protein FRC17_009548 [Serendipita sp. 399]|nr:hypothetical protein FRC17_009548 [Serendipita sp. 399]
MELYGPSISLQSSMCKLNSNHFVAGVQRATQGCPRLLRHHPVIVWRAHICPFIMQSLFISKQIKILSDECIAILTTMILYKSVWLKAKSEYARGIMGLLARDGAIVYLGVLSMTVIVVLGSFTTPIRIQLTASNLLLPLYSLSTSRILLNLRLHLSSLGFNSVRGNAIVSGLELTSLYLGGNYGGIAPARGIRGATVKEMGNTTMVNVPVEDYETEEESRNTRYYRHQRSISSNYSPPSTADGQQLSLSAMLPKVSTLGANPGWEQWGDRVPTRDVRLSAFQPFISLDPNTNTNTMMTVSWDDQEGRGSSSSMHDDDRDGVRTRRRDMHTKGRSRDTSIHWAEPCCMDGGGDDGSTGSSSSSPRQTGRNIEGPISLRKQSSLPSRTNTGAAPGIRTLQSPTLSRSRSIPRQQYTPRDVP